MERATDKVCAYRGCRKKSSYGAEGIRKAVFCNEHKEGGMLVVVRSTQCVYHGCSVRASYGEEGSKRSKFCNEHKTAGMVNVRNPRCAYDGCSKRPSFGKEGSKKAEFCSEHKAAGTVNVRNKRCAYDGCSKQPNFGSKGTRKAEFCSEHKEDGMLNVMSGQCAYHGCSVRPSYGEKGSRRSEFCNKHKTAGMVDVRSTRCAYDGCSKQPNFGSKGSRKAEFCSEHKEDGMLNVTSGQCAYHGCYVRPSFGKKDSKRPEFCNEHKAAGMVAVIRKRCAYDGCSKQPRFGSEGSRKVEVCSQHKTTGMVDLFKRTCVREGCVKHALRGQDGSRRKMLLCGRHFAEIDRGGAPAPEDADTRKMGDGNRKRTGEPVSVTSSRKRAIRIENSPEKVLKTSDSFDCGRSGRKRMRVLGGEMLEPSQEAQKESPPVRVSSPTRSPILFTPRASCPSSCQPQDIYNRQLDDRAKSRQRNSTRSEGRKRGAHELTPASCVVSAKLATPMANQCVESTDTGERDLTDPKRSVSQEGSPCDVGGEQIDGGNRNNIVTSGGAVADTRIASISGLGNHHARATCGFAPHDRQEKALLEQGRHEAADKVKNLQDIVEQLTSQVSNAAVDKVRAVADAIREGEERLTKNVQALRSELSTASKLIKEKANAHATVCEERHGLRQQVTNAQALLTSATSKIKSDSAKTEISKQIFQKRIKALRVELNAASMGWESTKEAVKTIRQERDALKTDLQHAIYEKRRQCEEVKKLRRERDALHKELQQSVSEKRRQCEHAKTICQERDALNKELEQAVSEKRRQCEDVKTISQERDALHKELQQAVSEKRRQCEDVKTIRKERDALQKELQQAVSESRRQFEDVKKICQERDALQKVVQQAVLEKRRQCGDATKLRQERDDLHNELEAHVAFYTDMISKAAAHSKVLADRVKRVKEGRGTPIQTSEIVGPIAQEPEIPGSPAVYIAAAAAAQSAGGSPATELTTQASEAPSSNILNGSMGETKVDDGTGVCRLENYVAPAAAVETPGFHDVSMVEIKPEDEQPQARES